MAQPAASPGSRAAPGSSAGRADRRWLILVVVALAQLMVVLDATIVNIALPSAQRSLGFADSDRQWVVTAYALAFGSLLLVGGRLGDMFSRKWVFISGLVGFAVASAIGGAAVSFLMLVSARALQGAFGAILALAALGTLVSTFRDPRERGRAFAVFGSVAAGGGAVGAMAFIRSNRPATRPRMDWTGAVFACTGLFLIVFGFSHADTAGWAAPLTIGSLAPGTVLLAAFVTAERRVSHPLLPLRVILDRTRGSSYVAIGVTGVAIFGVFLFLTYYMQQVKGYSPVTTGLLFLPMVGGILVASTISSVVLLPRVGSRVLITAGLLLSGGGTAYLGQLTVTSGYPAHILPALLAMGLGFGMIFAPATNTATAGVPTNDSGVASALVNTMQQVGGSIGVSILSTVAASATTSYLLAHHTGTRAAATASTQGYTVAFTISAALLGLGALLAVLMLPSHRRSGNLNNEDTILVPAPPATAAADAAPAPQRRK